MNTLNSKTNGSNNSMYQFTDELNLKNPNKNMALANLSICYTLKNIKSEYNTVNLKFLLQLGMMNLICLMEAIPLQIYRIILNISLKNMKLLQIVLLYKFM